MRRMRAIAGLSIALLAVGGHAADRAVFATPTAAAQAFISAVAAKDGQTLASVLGDNWKDYIPTEGLDEEDVTAFLEAAESASKIVTEGDAAHLQVGVDSWQLPIPIVKTATGWQFDVAAGAAEIRIRRIGRNELDVLKVLQAIVAAQAEYASVDRNGDHVKEYAQRFISKPGLQDGLYWATPPDEPDSPLGPAFAEEMPGDGYHGYRYKILREQGDRAAGSAQDYRVDGRLVNGFAVLAWPSIYGDTGVTSFIVNQAGVVFGKDLGPDTEALAKAMTSYDPDTSWRRE